MNQTIEIIVDPSGAARLQTRGFAGPGCREASRLLEQALGTVSSDAPTPEMYQLATEAQPLRQEG